MYSARADEKIWQVQDDLRRLGFLAYVQRQGNFIIRRRSFTWSLASDLIDEAPDIDLYRIDLAVSWRIGKKNFNMSRVAYAIYRYEE